MKNNWIQNDGHIGSVNDLSNMLRNLHGIRGARSPAAAVHAHAVRGVYREDDPGGQPYVPRVSRQTSGQQRRQDVRPKQVHPDEHETEAF